MNKSALAGLSYEDSLAHYGVKGMRWGVRKADLPAPTVRSKGITIRADGSISVEKGASIQRLVRSSGKSLPMKDITYASLNDYDNARYIKFIGGKGFFGGGRDQILGITATRKIEAPSKKEATQLVSELMLSSQKFRQKNTDMFGETISKRELKKIEKDPTGQVATKWYDITNQKLTFDKEFDPDAPYVQSVFRSTFEAKGYSAVRDENDVGAGLSKSPIIIFSPEKSLKVTSITNITDAIRQANKEKLKLYKSQGKDWLERELYG